MLSNVQPAPPVVDLQVSCDKLNSAVRDIDSNYGRLNSEIKQLLGGPAVTSQPEQTATIRALTGWQAKLPNDLAERKAAAEKLLKALERTLANYKRRILRWLPIVRSLPPFSDETSFAQEATISRDDTHGRMVTVTLEVAAPDDKGKLGDLTKKLTLNIQMGYQVMTVSAGLAGSPMKKAQYNAVTTTVKDANGQSTTTNTVGIQSNSPRLLPMIQLNADLFDFSSRRLPVSLNASLGLTGKVDNQGTDVEFLLGPSLGFLGNQLFVTVGAYGGRQQVLQGGLSAGSIIPSTTVPVAKNLQWGLGWSLTWKIK